MVHQFNGVCMYVYTAALDIFKRCGKDFQATYKSAKEENVSVDKMKKWLEQIRKEARSKRYNCDFDFLRYFSKLFEFGYLFNELVSCTVSECMSSFTSRWTCHNRSNTIVQYFYCNIYEAI